MQLYKLGIQLRKLHELDLQFHELYVQLRELYELHMQLYDPKVARLDGRTIARLQRYSYLQLYKL